MRLDQSYNPKDFEDDIYSKWLNKKYFAAKVNRSKKPFTLVSPPPNITSQLHIGHAFNITLQDILIRYKRMKGYEACWIQGTDHAAIATEVKIIEKLKKEENLTKEDLGRAEFGKRVAAWYNDYNGIILNQFKKMGVSADWDRPAFTMDKKCSDVVKHTFVKLYNKGLIYKGDRIISWCPCCKTAISDAELEYEENDGKLWYMNFELVGVKDKALVIATTRPETIFGDTAVAVNPKDQRYKDLVGKMVRIPICGREIPIIADNYVESEFGTGAVKITPAHDPNDFAVGKRHSLPMITVINEDGTMNSHAGKYSGQDRYLCRKNLIADLETVGLLAKAENHKNNVAHCYRCHSIVEPLLSKQWFVSMKSLAKPAIEAVKKGNTKFLPDRMKKIYFHWLENIDDWCISRQLWSGHKIPIYTCNKCGEVLASVDDPKSCPKCSCKIFTQEQDVLDTWFSSGLWPFSTLGYLENSEDYQYFYPADVNVTAYDIIFFWVARMIFMSIEMTGKTPFKDVLMHGLVRDGLGRKMSKSLGNGVDPLVMIEKFGADPLRFSLINGVAVGGDSRYSEDKTKSASEFINKIWNAGKFVLMNMDEVDIHEIEQCELTSIDKWMLHELNNFLKNFNAQMDKYDFGLCSTLIQEFFWDKFCDYYIEFVKLNLFAKSKYQISVVKYVYEQLLKILHPFIPFVTEDIFTTINRNEQTIMILKYPEYSKKFVFEKEDRQIASIIELIKGVRNARAEKNIATNIKTALIILPLKEKDVIEECAGNIEKLAFGNSVKFISNEDEMKDDAIISISEIAKVFLPLNEAIDFKKELARLEKELIECQQKIDQFRAKLDNPSFVERAPAQIVEQERGYLNKHLELKRTIQDSIKKYMK